jgi:hypothetical protein
MKGTFFLFFVFSIFMLFISIRYRAAISYAYYFLSFVISILLIIMIYRSNGKKQCKLFLSIAIICIFLRSVYLIASDFSLIPLDDGYRDYAVAMIFLENGRSSVVNSGAEETFASYVSGWPLIHILAVSLSEILSLDLLYVVLALPLIFSVGILTFIYLLMREIVSKLGVSQRVVPLALLIYAISPDNIYTSMQFVRQNFGIVFITIIFYLLYRRTQINAKSTRIELLFLIFSFALVLVHDFSPFTILLFFSLFFILTQIGNQILDRVKWKIQSIHSVSLVTLTLFSVTMFAWWIFHSPITMTTYLPWLSWGIHLSVYTGTLDLAMTSWRFYRVLRPEPYANLLILYYIAVYVPLVISFLMFIKKTISRKKMMAHAQFLTYSVTALFTIFLIYESLLNLEPIRVLWLSAPFIALFTALLYDRLFSAKNALWRILAAALLIMVAFTTFLAPWSRGYMPLYIYDPSVKSEDVGHHNPHYVNVVPFVKDHVHYENFEAILSDDPDLLYVILPTGSHSMVKNIYSNPEMINDTNIILFEFIRLNPSFHAVPYVYLQNPGLLENTEAFKRQIMYTFNVVYDDGSSKIHRR